MVPIPKIETLEEQDADTPASKNGLLPGTFWGNRWRSVKETAQVSYTLHPWVASQLYDAEG